MDSDQRLFMQSVVKQCSSFFLSLHKYCEDYSQTQFGAVQPIAAPSKKSLKRTGLNAPVDGSATKTKKKKSKKTDVDKPKKPLTPFFKFFMKHRDGVKEQNPTFTATEVTQELGKGWNKLTDEARAKYEEEFKKEYEVYKVCLSDYYKSKGIDPSTVKQTKKKKSKKHQDLEPDVAELAKRAESLEQFDDISDSGQEGEDDASDS